MIFSFKWSKEFAKKIAARAKLSYSEIFLENFPDGESHIEIKADVKGKKVFIVESLFDPNEKIVNLLFAAYTLKELGAKKVVLVAPYLAYMRQDRRFRKGDCVSSVIVAKLFNVFDEIVTVDPHLHRFHNMNQLFKAKTKKLSANSLIAGYIKKTFKNPVIIGPDSESYQWAKTIAEKVKSHAIVLKKKRYSAKKVRIKIKGNVDFSKNDVVIVDDIISTGHTMMETVKEAKRLGAKRVYCICVHGIFADNAYAKLKKLGAKQVISTNTIPNKACKIDVSGMVAGVLKCS